MSATYDDLCSGFAHDDLCSGFAYDDLCSGFAYDAVIFDLDGTLVDSASGLHMAATAMLGRLELSAPDLSRR